VSDASICPTLSKGPFNPLARVFVWARGQQSRHNLHVSRARPRQVQVFLPKVLLGGHGEALKCRLHRLIIHCQSASGLWHETFSFCHIGHDDKRQEGWWPSKPVPINTNILLKNDLVAISFLFFSFLLFCFNFKLVVIVFSYCT
jgi:hypothetical protein